VLADLKAFLLRGNVVDLAVAVILGMAFNAVVSAFVAVLLALVGAVFRVPDLSAGVVTVRGSAVPTGALAAAVLNFWLVGTALFVVVRAAKRFQRPPVESTPAPESDEVVLLREIRDELRARGAPGRPTR